MLQVVKNFPNKTLFYLMLISSLLIISVKAFSWTLLCLYNPLVVGLVEISLFKLFLIISFWALCYLGFKFREMGFIALIPLIISLVTFVTIVFVPFNQIAIQAEWMNYRDDRTKVVQMIESGELSDGKLPQEYKNLAKAGKVIISRRGSTLQVFFMTYQGILNNYAGYTYVSDNQGSSSNIDPLGGTDFTVEKLADDWYWVYSSN